jgi:hypothetical protein
MKKKAVLGLSFTLLAFVFFLIPSKEISDAIATSVIFCGKTVIPQLFLYICLSSIVWELGIVENIVFAFPKYGAEIASFFIGILSGFPSGAIISGKMYEKGIITKKRAEYLSTFSNNAGISFVFGYLSTIVGKTGALSLFLCQLFFSAVYAAIGRLSLSKADKETAPSPFLSSTSVASVTKAIKKASESMINICGFILFFSIFSMALLSKAPLFFRGITELTTGLSLLCPLPFQSRLWYCGLFLGFSGVCVHFQVLSSCPVGAKKYILSKCISALLFPPTACFIQKIITSV